MKVRQALTIALTNRVLFAIEKLIKLNSSVKGVENIPQNTSIIFTPNHFTRCETFIVPYLLNQIPNLKFCRSLAFSSLFTSYLGKYLTNLKTLSTSHPNRDEVIIESLASGDSNWVVYPEGMMVKDRKREATHTLIETKLSIKTGTSVIAIKAEILRQDSDENPNSVCIVPVTINYTPIHPDSTNKILKIAQRFVKRLPKRLEEELTVEGSLLLNSKICLEIHKPILIGDYINRESYIAHFLGIENEKTTEEQIAKHRLPISARIADEIYKHTYITYEHIISAILKEKDVIERNLLPYYIISCVSNLRKYSNIQRFTDGLSDDEILKNILDTSKINHFLALLQEQDCIHIDGEFIHTNKKFHTYDNFDDIRIQNISKVFINELYYFKNVSEIVRNASSLNSFKIMKECLQYIDEMYLRKHEITQSPHSIDVKYGIAKYINGTTDRATLFIHGYKSSPAEIFELAHSVNKLNVACYCVRLEGHGTSPFDMASVTKEQWQNSCEIAYKILLVHFKSVDICGFSTGGLLAIKLASKYKVRSISVINAALKLCDIRFRYVKFAKMWSDINANLLKGNRKYIIDKPFYPQTNYAINHFSSMHQLSLLMSEVEEILPMVKCNTLVIFSSHDPVVSPKSGGIIYNSISSNVRFLEEVESNEHVIVRGKSMNEVGDLVKKFLL